LRAAGLDVHPGRMLDVVDALAHVDVGARDEVYHACRALLVHRHDDLATFDRVFDAFWRGRTAAADAAVADRRDDGTNIPPAGERPEAGASSAMEPIGDAAEGAPAAAALRTWSDAATLVQKDFAAFTDDEVAVAAAALNRLQWHPGYRRTRRWVAGRGAGIDLRRALARSVRTGGDVFDLPRRVRRTRPRPLVLLCDVSGSMERYSRMLLHFAHALRRRHRRVEAFVFSTQLQRITPELRTGRLDGAVAAIGRRAGPWSGGTRIGEALRQLHVHWRRRVLHGGPVALLISDGWDRGDPAVLRDQTARLQRCCHRLIWLNPLIGTENYAPLTRGLQAALPFVDDFLPVRTLTNLADLAVHLDTLTIR
jgi:uncharacterized protein with von Willebrand factor type A (vWA) domain